MTTLVPQPNTGIRTRAEALEEFDFYASWFIDKYNETDLDPDIDRALGFAELAAAATEDDDVKLPPRIQLLCDILNTRYRKRKEPGDLDAMVAAVKRLLGIMPLEDRNRSVALTLWWETSKEKFERDKSQQDLDDTITCGIQLLQQTSRENQHIADYTIDLALHFLFRYEKDGSLPDLDEATVRAQHAEFLLHDSIESWGRVYTNQAKIYNAKFQRTLTIETLNDAITSSRKAVFYTPIDGQLRATALSNLCTTLQSRFERTGSVDDLREAIQVGHEAVIVAGNDPNLSWLHSNLALAYKSMFDQEGGTEDLEEAINIAKKAVSTIRSTVADTSILFNNLALYLDARYERKGSTGDLVEAISMAEKGVEMNSSTPFNRAVCLSTLSSLLIRRYSLSPNTEDLNKARDGVEKALQEVPEVHALRAGLLNNLGHYLYEEFQRSGKPEVLEASIQNGKRSLEVTPVDHPSKARRLINVADRLVLKNNLTDAAPKSEEALSLYKQAWECDNAHSIKRIEGARSACEILVAYGRLKEASDISDGVLKLIPILSPRSLQRDDQQYLLSHISGIVSDSCSLALKVGKSPTHALGLLELGRGVMMSNIIDTRTEITVLENEHPEISRRFQQLQIELDSNGSENDSGTSGPSSIQRRREAISQLEFTLTQIRKLAGFERFLLPPGEEDLKKIARNGPIIVVNATNISTDAMVVTSTSIQSLRLPNLKFSDILKWNSTTSGQFFVPSLSTYFKNNKLLTEMLIWLWTSTVKPILVDHLHLSLRKNSKSLPRIWWLGVGSMSLFPIHAAGSHQPGSTENIYHYAMSSYIPTIKALAYSQERPFSLLQKPTTKLLIATNRELPGVVEETKVLHNIAATAATTLPRSRIIVDEETSSSAILSRLGALDIIHCACHGKTDTRDPSKSALLLTPSSEPENLTVSQISSIHTGAQLAYLSACRTAYNTTQKLIDENIHIASGFQLAGFTHVVGTLWEVSDEVCVGVAKEFYQRLFCVGGGRCLGSVGNDSVIDEDSKDKPGDVVVKSLGEAVRRVREENWKDVLAWAPFIHLGP